MNKFIDISILQWFEYDFLEYNEAKLIGKEYLGLPTIKFPQFFGLEQLVKYFAVPISYFIHLLAPFLYFNRTAKKLIIYWLFYSIFHYMTIYVGILFTANFFAWFMLFPIFNDKR